MVENPSGIKFWKGVSEFHQLISAHSLTIQSLEQQGVDFKKRFSNTQKESWKTTKELGWDDDFCSERLHKLDI